MTRRNTASQSMIEDFAELKKQGITEFWCMTDTGSKTLSPVIKKTAQGVSSYANSMYRKYGDSVAVEVYYFDSEFNCITYCTYGA